MPNKRRRRQMDHDELAGRRAARQDRALAAEARDAAEANLQEHGEPYIEELGQRAAAAYLASQRAVALEEPEVKLELLWREVERWTDAYIQAIRRAGRED